MKKKKLKAKLAVGPMSSEVIEAVYRFSDDNEVQIMLISSKAQIDHNGGYVNNWTTAQYVEHMKQLILDFGYTNADVLVCRDHCGPGFKATDDLLDHFRTVDADIEAGFDLIHVDMCHAHASHQEKLEMSRKLIEHVQDRDKDMKFEIGTDENVGTAEVDLARIASDIDYFKAFCDPEFYVVQTGTLIKEINQVGTYHEDAVKQMSELLHSKGVKLKEHNADYLGFGDLKHRRGVVDAINIAPMLGVLQTSFVLHRCLHHGFDTTAFLNKAYESGRWKKWLLNNTSENKYLCALTAGHYVFTSDEYKRLVDRLDKAEGGITESIVQEHYDLIDNYMIGLGEVS
jgi:hypothetical protein